MPTTRNIPPEKLADDEVAACVDALFQHCRQSGFPVYDLSRAERRRRLESLLAFDYRTILKGGIIRQTVHGISLCWYFQPHSWEIRCGNKRTPMEVFMDDDLLRKAIEKRLRMNGYISDNGLRKAISNFSGTQRVSNFRPTAAAAVYHELLPASGGVTWDFCGGFGGRLLGALACDRVKRYVATDPSTYAVEGLQEMASELMPLTGRRIDVELHRVGSEDYVPERNSITLAASSPPFWNWERYSNEASQSYIKFPGKQEWLEGYLGKTLDNCRIGLKASGKLAVNIAGVVTYPTLEADFLGLARRGGWKHIGTLQMELSRMVGTKHIKAALPAHANTSESPSLFSPHADMATRRPR